MSRRCRLYLISPPIIADPSEFAGVLSATLAAGDVAALQIRLKPASRDAVTAVVKAALPAARANNVALILNDDPELAQELDCDGVHVGQGDMSCREARAIIGPDRIVGVTCHASRHLAMLAGEAGADYVAFGAFFDSRTKAAPTRASLEILSDWQMTMLTPCVAIGGIEVANCWPIVAAGADFLAVSSGVWAYAQGPAAAVVAFNTAIAATLEARS